MNKIFIEDLTSHKDLYLNESTIVIVKNSDCRLNYFIRDEINVFTLVMSSKAKVSCVVECNCIFNVFSANSSLNIDIDLLKNDINYKYAYSSINKDDNGYSNIYSLDDYDVRFDKKVINEYLKGHYKAIPIWE